MPVWIDFVCPVCEHAAGRTQFDDDTRGQCAECSMLIEFEPQSRLMIPAGSFEPSARMLARRVEAPKRTKIRFKCEAQTLRIWRTFGILSPFAKRYTLSAEGLVSSKAGFTHPTASIRGFMLMQIVAGFLGEPGAREANTMTCSVVVVRDGDLVLYQPLFAHSREDGAYFCSLLNEQLERVRHPASPYRG